MKKSDTTKFLRRPGLFAALIGVFAIGVALAQLGTVLTSFSPAPAGNGRGVAHDPATGEIFFTNAGDTNIYVVDTTGTPIRTLSPGINFGALSWDAKRGVLWGGRYDGTGGVDQIHPITGAVTPQFAFVFPVGDSCYPQGTGFIDGLAYDEGPTSANGDDSLWLSDDNAKTLFNVDLAGVVIGNFPIPAGRCNTGIAVDGQYLWLALQSGPDTPPHDIIRVAKVNPTIVLSTFNFDVANPGPEDIELDVTTFQGKCALWSNQFTVNTIKAWELEEGLKPECFGKPGKIVGWGIIGSKTSPEKIFKIWAKDTGSLAGVVGTVEVTDKVHDVIIKSTNLIAANTIMMPSKKGLIKGFADVSEGGIFRGNFEFQIDVEDNADPSNGQDVFTISMLGYMPPWMPAGYQNSGNVRMGDINVVK